MTTARSERAVPAKKAPAKKAPAKKVDELRDRIFEATMRYGKENDSCKSGIVDFISEVLDENSEDVEREYLERLESTVTFTVKVKTTLPMYNGMTQEEINLENLDNYEFGESVLEMLGFNTTSSNDYNDFTLEIS